MKGGCFVREREKVADNFALSLVYFGLQRPPAWHGCLTYRSQQINQHSVHIANLNRQGYREIKLHVILVEEDQAFVLSVLSLNPLKRV